MYQKVHWSAGLGEVDCPSVECDKYQAASVLTVITSVCLQRNFSRNYCCAGQPSISLLIAETGQQFLSAPELSESVVTRILPAGSLIALSQLILTHPHRQSQQKLCLSWMVLFRLSIIPPALITWNPFQKMKIILTKQVSFENHFSTVHKLLPI